MRVIALLLALPLALLAAPAHAAPGARVALGGPGGAAVDPTYATTLTVKGSGFQAIKGGFGGVYVLFGTVDGSWRPSKGGVSGRNFLFVPDSQSKDNAGYEKFVAFPGSDTASSANAVMSASGSWSTTLVVPGAAFDAVDANGAAHHVDCRKVTCGVITIGAHGVADAHNETFTPVAVRSLYGASSSASPKASASSAPASPTAPVGSATSGGASTAPDVPDAPGVPAAPAAPAAKPALVVDRTSARPGHVLPFAATGLTPGSQLSAVLDDGLAGAGPFLVGADGGLGGVVSLPRDIEGGTHRLRLFGAGGDAASIRFAVISSAGTTQVKVPTASASSGPGTGGWIALAVGAVAVLAAVGWRLRGLLPWRRHA